MTLLYLCLGTFTLSNTCDHSYRWRFFRHDTCTVPHKVTRHPNWQDETSIQSSIPQLSLVDICLHAKRWRTPLTCQELILVPWWLLLPWISRVPAPSFNFASFPSTSLPDYYPNESCLHMQLTRRCWFKGVQVTHVPNVNYYICLPISEFPAEHAYFNSSQQLPLAVLPNQSP